MENLGFSLCKGEKRRRWLSSDSKFSEIINHFHDIQWKIYVQWTVENVSDDCYSLIACLIRVVSPIHDGSLNLKEYDQPCKSSWRMTM